MEVEYIIEKLGDYLGGIDVEKVKQALGNKPTGVERILGIVAEEGEGLERLECMRIKTFIDAYKKEEKRLVALYRELKTSGVTPSDMAFLKRKIKYVKRQIRIYKEMKKRCQGHQGRSVTSRGQTPEFTSQ